MLNKIQNSMNSTGITGTDLFTESSNPKPQEAQQQAQSKLRLPIKTPGAASTNESMKLYSRFIKLSKLYSISLIVQISLTIFYYQLSYAGSQTKANFLVNLQTGVSLVSILLSIFTQISRNEWNISQNLRQWQLRPFKFIFPACIILAQPYVFLQEQYIQNWDFQDQISVPFKLNYLMVNFSLFKIGLIFINFMFSLKYRNPRSSRICNIYGSRNSHLFSLKSLFKHHPIILMKVFFTISLLIFSFMYRVNERNRIPNPNLFEYFGNCIWVAFITMTTVGYGDITPITYIGRIFGYFCAFCGAIIISILVLVAINMFQMDRHEQEALKMLKILSQKRKLKKIAGKYIRLALWRLWQNKKLKKYKTDTIIKESREQKSQKSLLKQGIAIYKFNKSSTQKFMGLEMCRQFEKSFARIQSINQNSDTLLSYLGSQNFINTDKIKKCTDPLYNK